VSKLIFMEDIVMSLFSNHDTAYRSKYIVFVIMRAQIEFLRIIKISARNVCSTQEEENMHSTLL